MPPPPASSAASRLLLRPALRTQSDRRLVSLVRDGYENAFEEIVRRYGKVLGRYAAAIVPSHRAEDVTQDAFSKALLALRGADKEIELWPWLYRIVRNTALNDLRDQPPPTAVLDERIDGVEAPPETVERREEIAELLNRLQALPEPQRAAIVMRELEGLSHEEIAAALGLTGGAARQTIYRARRALRNGFGMLIPVPLLHLLLSGGAAGAASGAALGGAALGGAGAAGAASAGGAGAGLGLKAGVASVVLAGSVATGVALNGSSGDRDLDSEAVAKERAGGPGGPQATIVAPGSDDRSASGHRGEEGDDRGHGEGDGREGRRGHDDDRGDDDRRRGRSNSGHGGDDADDDRSGSGSGSGSDDSDEGGSNGSGSGSSGSGDFDDDADSSGSGSGDDEPDDDD